jgi:hypothetical protein
MEVRCNRTETQTIMQGLLVFHSLVEAVKSGYQVYDRTDFGYLVRIRTAAGWQLAIVVPDAA